MAAPKRRPDMWRPSRAPWNRGTPTASALDADLLDTADDEAAVVIDIRAALERRGQS